MSLMGSVVILITILARFLLRKRSKTFIMILWAVVALRLIVPFSIESAFSIFNYVPLPTQGAPAVEVSEAVLPDTDIDAYQAPANNIDYAEAPVDAGSSANVESPAKYANEVSTGHKADVRSLPDIKSVVAIIWFTGLVVFTTYICVRYFDLKEKLKNAKKIGKNVYECDNVKSPFVFGFLVPKMYLPDTLDEAEREYVMVHESTHIKHGDWLKKLLGIAILAVHWFNPLVWVAFTLFEQDIEMSCDETTISSLDADLRKAYAISIVSYAKASNNSNKKYMVTPLGFSKNVFCKAEVTKRVMNIVNFKKGTKVTTIVILAAVLAKGKTIIKNANTRPEVIDMIDFLNAMGADISYKTRYIEIKGVNELHGGEYTIIKDSHEAVSYMIFAAMMRSEIMIKDFDLRFIDEDVTLLRQIGADVFEWGNNVYASAKGKILKPFSMATSPYPGINSDMQPLLAALACTIEGESIITDTRFTERFQYVEEFRKFGFDIVNYENCAVVHGTNSIQGTDVYATDLRAGAALTFLGCWADGITHIDNYYQTLRGYVGIIDKLRSLGVDITGET